MHIRPRTLLILLDTAALFVIGSIHAAHWAIVFLSPQTLGIEVVQFDGVDGNRGDISVTVPDSLLAWRARAFWFALDAAAIGIAIGLVVLLRKKSTDAEVAARCG